MNNPYEINNARKEHCLHYIHCIFNTLISLNHKGYGLLDGGAGIALFYYYYGLITDKPVDRIIDREIELSFETLQNLPTHATYASGYAGYLYGLNMLNNLLTEGYQLDDSSLRILNNQIQIRLEQNYANQYYDYLHGYLGTGLYFISSNNKLKVDQMVGYLNQTKLVTGSNMYHWITNNASNKQEINIGLSHGVAGVVGFLAQVILVDKSNSLALELLNGAIKFILSTKMEGEKSLFPYYTNTEYVSRLSWCYGDLSVATSIMSAANCCGREDWKLIAVDIAKLSAIRVDPSDTGVVDACFCHGSSGLLHVFNRFYLATGLPIFREAVDFWYTDTCEKIELLDTKVNVKTWYGSTESWTYNQPGILEGIAGIGLSMIHYLRPDIFPKWQRSLLIEF